MRKNSLLFFFVLALILLQVHSTPVRAWGGDVHKEIADQAMDLLPDELANFIKTHKNAIKEASVEPDERKSSDPAEGPRHYDDSDIPHQDRNVLSSSTDYRHGVVSWAVENATRDLTTALESNNTDDIIRYMGDVAHYISDAAQPFHATKNYDGQETGNNGIHARFESRLIENYWDTLFEITGLKPVQLIDDPYLLSEGEIESGLALVPDILEADDKASSKAGDVNSDAYYTEFDNLIGDIANERLTLAIQNTANLWATAFHSAGWIEIVTETSTNSTQSTTSTDLTTASPTQSLNSTLFVSGLIILSLLVSLRRRITV